MTNNTSGNQSLLNDLDKLNEVLDNYENGILSSLEDISEDEIDSYTKIPLESIQRMAHEECSAIAYKLGAYSLYIQRIQNKESGVVKWCDAVINSLCAKHWGDYSDFIKGDIKMAIIAQENEAVKNIQKIKVHAEQRRERLFMIASSIKFMADCMIENARSKRKNES